MTFSTPHTVCTMAEYILLQKMRPRLVEALGTYLIPMEEMDYSSGLPLIFVFYGTERQMQYWLLNKDIDPKHVRLITEPNRLQGLRARAIPIRIDPYWHPVGLDERVGFDSSEWYLKDMESKVGSLWDIWNQVNPVPENERWIRLA